MFEKASQMRSKRTAAVCVTLTDGERFSGGVYLKYDERLIDLMNDPRAFIPVLRHDGAVVILAKTSIATIAETDANSESVQPAASRPATVARGDDAARDVAEDGPAVRPADGDPAPGPGRQQTSDGRVQSPPPQRKSDAYRILKVAEDATLEEIRSAFKARMKSVHPDAVASRTDSADSQQTAHAAAQLVNRAYRSILAERETRS